MTFLLENHSCIRDACLQADPVMYSHKCAWAPGLPEPSPGHFGRRLLGLHGP